MTGVEQMTVWLLALLCASVTVRSIAKLIVAGRTAVASFRAQVDAHRASVDAWSCPASTLRQWTEDEL